MRMVARRAGLTGMMTKGFASTPNAQRPTPKASTSPASFTFGTSAVGSWGVRRTLLCSVPKPCAILLGVLALLTGSSWAQETASRASRDAGTVASAVQRIEQLLARQDLAAAQAAVDAALRLDPDAPALHNVAGVIAAQQGAFETAERHFTRAIALAPKAAAPYENLGRLYQERGATDPSARAKALDVYRRLLGVDPANIEAMYQAGFLLTLSGTFGEARALLARLPDPVRQKPQVLAVLAVAEAGAGGSAPAASIVERLAAHPELTAADVLAVLPATGHLEDDTVLLEMLGALDRRNLAPPDALLQLGRLQRRHQRFAEARAVLERALARGGPSAPVLSELGRVTARLGEHETALGYLAHARSLAPDDADVHFLFGIVCVEMNLGAEAYESLKKAVALAPDNPHVNYAMGSVSLHRHDPSESLPYFEKYVRLAPGDPRGRFALGVARFYSKDFEGARRDLEQVADRPETKAGAQYFLGRIARQSGDVQTARRAIEAALKANPSYPNAWAELGLLQTRAGEYAEAEQSLRKALTLDPDNYQATVHLTALFTRTCDARLEQQQARLQALQQKRDREAQDFLRIVEVVPR